ncbi:ABC transporter permease [Bifidobacterium vespertilionis]|uniref:ABC transporter permease n=1 Tax=Bifidobacterium vespertilionis TaxID=2562524 RepID=UPI001BDC68C9|nr:ABC transporter permease subunit [Bifidobacterium vespertilionis]MBT1179668.1 ABC transporter permease subunit [Bifidobacterium vespertilionis]
MTTTITEFAAQARGRATPATKTAATPDAAGQTGAADQPTAAATLPAVDAQADRPARRALPYPLTVAFTAAGFLIAALVNVFFPQIKPVEFEQGQLWIFLLNGEEAYRALLVILALLYVVIGVVDARRGSADVARFRERAQFRFAAGLALALWDVTGTKLQTLPQPFFPGPSKVIEPFLTDGDYIALNTFYSVRLFAAGFIVGVFLGVVTGVIIGWFARAYYWVFPVLKITGVIPAVAWMPFALTLMPTPFIAAMFLLVICSWFPVAFLTAQGIQSTPKMLIEASRTLGADTPYILFHVAIPNAMPSIFTGIGMANSLSFLTLVISEMMGQPGGLGYYIDQAKSWSAYNEILTAIVVMAVLFSLIMKLIELVRGHVLRWQKGLVK